MFDDVSLQVADSWGNWSREREEREAKEAREEGGREVSWLLERRRKCRLRKGEREPDSMLERWLCCKLRICRLCCRLSSSPSSLVRELWLRSRATSFVKESKIW